MITVKRTNSKNSNGSNELLSWRQPLTSLVLGWRILMLNKTSMKDIRWTHTRLKNKRKPKKKKTTTPALKQISRILSRSTLRTGRTMWSKNLNRFQISSSWIVWYELAVCCQLTSIAWGPEIAVLKLLSFSRGLRISATTHGSMAIEVWGWTANEPASVSLYWISSCSSSSPDPPGSDWEEGAGSPRGFTSKQMPSMSPVHQTESLRERETSDNIT